MPCPSNEGEDIVYSPNKYRETEGIKGDKAKGIISNPMPPSWYQFKECMAADGDDDETIERKHLYESLCAHKKPYFFQYNYDSLRRTFVKYTAMADKTAKIKFGKDINGLRTSEELTDEEAKFLQSYYNKCDLDFSPSTMNRICWRIEDEFGPQKAVKVPNFDYSLLKNDTEYSRDDIKNVLMEWKNTQQTIKKVSKNATNNEEINSILLNFDQKMHEMMQNDAKLCNIMIDLCCQGKIGKGALWQLCGQEIVRTLLQRHDGQMTYPVRDVNGELFCRGLSFRMETSKYEMGDLYEGIQV